MSRNKDLGQFWTPDWVAKAMVGFALDIPHGRMLDPAVGLGVFPKWAQLLNISLDFVGVEKDPSLIRQIPDESIRGRVINSDFLAAQFGQTFDFVVANPPYIRHHKIPTELKNRIHKEALSVLGFELDRRAGLHVFFLIKSLSLLRPGGRLAFIVPADVFEGKFAPRLWRWIGQRYCIRAVVTFVPEATPFPELDVNPVIVFIENTKACTELRWARVLSQSEDDLFRFVASQFQDAPPSVSVITRPTAEAISTGLSRPPRTETDYLQLKDFAYVRRGIATGANDFFLLTKEQVQALGLDEQFIRPAVPKTRYLDTLFFTQADFDRLAIQGKPVFLFSPDGRPLDQFPKSVQTYLRQGEKLGLPDRALLRQRNPWYKMETRNPPDFFFAYLGRRNIRFVRNLAGALPLTTLLAVYAHSKDEAHLRTLHRILNHPDVLAGLVYIAKSYGRGALKAEPRQLEKLPIPKELGEELVLQPALL
jgi:hypothetical protein